MALVIDEAKFVKEMKDQEVFNPAITELNKQKFPEQLVKSFFEELNSSKVMGVKVIDLAGLALVSFIGVNVIRSFKIFKEK